MPSAALSDADLLARLVAFDTTSHRSNLEMADFLADYLDRPGVRIRRVASPDGEKANLLVFAGPALDGEDGDDRRGLVLSGHMDVVPAGDGWTSDPFTLTDAGDSWVARGSADMKGFLALAANVARAVDPARLAAPLALVLTYDEEVGMFGARRLAETWPGLPGREPLPRAAVIGEPTELRVVAAHKGHLKVRAVMRGRSAHSGYPHLGINAIEPAGRAIVALSELRRSLEVERPPAGARFAEVPFAALNVGTVRGGTAVNVVPERCEIEIGVRLLPGMTADPMEQRVRETIEDAAGRGEPRAAVSVERMSESLPLAVRPEAPILAALAELTGGGAPGAVSYATDGGWLARLGLDCAVWGPGSITVAHQPDERIPKADLEAARPVLEALVERFCVRAEVA